MEESVGIGGAILIDPKKKDDIEALVEALDAVPLDEADGRDPVKALGIDVKKWAGSIRQRCWMTELDAGIKSGLMICRIDLEWSVHLQGFEKALAVKQTELMRVG